MGFNQRAPGDYSQAGRFRNYNLGQCLHLRIGPLVLCDKQPQTQCYRTPFPWFALVIGLGFQSAHLRTIMETVLPISLGDLHQTGHYKTRKINVYFEVVCSTEQNSPVLQKRLEPNGFLLCWARGGPRTNPRIPGQRLPLIITPGQEYCPGSKNEAVRQMAARSRARASKGPVFSLSMQ